MTSALKTLFHELFGDDAKEPAPVLELNEPAPVAEPPQAPVAITAKEDPMQKSDQQLIAAIFSDLYSVTTAQAATIEAQGKALASLSSQVAQLSTDFDVTQVQGYTPPPLAPQSGQTVQDAGQSGQSTGLTPQA